MDINLYHHFPTPKEQDDRQLVILKALTAIAQTQTVIVKNQETIMSQFDDMKAQATELAKDVKRVIASHGELRQALSDANAKIDELLKTDHLSAASQQTLNEAQAILVSADDDAEAAVPEAPAPSPPVEPTPPAEIPAPVEPTPETPA